MPGSDCAILFWFFHNGLGNHRTVNALFRSVPVDRAEVCVSVNYGVVKLSWEFLSILQQLCYGVSQGPHRCFLIMTLWKLLTTIKLGPN